MAKDKDRPDSGRFSEEAPDPNLNVNEPQRQRQISSGRQEEEEEEEQTSPKQREFSDALQESDSNAQQAGREAARRLSEGFLQGLGRRAGELVWDLLRGGHSS